MRTSFKGHHDANAYFRENFPGATMARCAYNRSPYAPRYDILTLPDGRQFFCLDRIGSEINLWEIGNAVRVSSEGCAE